MSSQINKRLTDDQVKTALALYKSSYTSYLMIIELKFTSGMMKEF